MIVDTLGEIPETDAAHSQWADEFATQLADLAEQLAEHREALEAEVNIDPNVLSGLDEAAEHIREAAERVTAHAQDYTTTYEGVRETAERTGGHIPGMDNSSGYWDETA